MAAKRISVMIIDDDKHERFFFRKAIHAMGPPYECLEAVNGWDALNQLRDADALPDYIFLDMEMPIIDGRECLAEIKRQDKLRHIPIIIISGWNDPVAEKMIKQLGADSYVHKTSDIGQLSQEILSVIKRVRNTI